MNETLTNKSWRKEVHFLLFVILRLRSNRFHARENARWHTAFEAFIFSVSSGQPFEYKLCEAKGYRARKKHEQTSVRLFFCASLCISQANSSAQYSSRRRWVVWLLKMVSSHFSKRYDSLSLPRHDFYQSSCKTSHAGEKLSSVDEHIVLQGCFGGMRRNQSLMRFFHWSIWL